MKRVYSDCLGDSTGDSIGLSKRERWREPNQYDQSSKEQFRHSARLHRRVLRPTHAHCSGRRTAHFEGATRPRLASRATSSVLTTRLTAGTPFTTVSAFAFCSSDSTVPLR